MILILLHQKIHSAYAVGGTVFNPRQFLTYCPMSVVPQRLFLFNWTILFSAACFIRTAIFIFSAKCDYESDKKIQLAPTQKIIWTKFFDWMKMSVPPAVVQKRNDVCCFRKRRVRFLNTQVLLWRDCTKPCKEGCTAMRYHFWYATSQKPVSPTENPRCCYAKNDAGGRSNCVAVLKSVKWVLSFLRLIFINSNSNFGEWTGRWWSLFTQFFVWALLC